MTLGAKCRQRRRPLPLCCVAALAVAAGPAIGAGAASPPDAREILGRAEAIRSPGVPFAVEFSIETSFPGLPGSTQLATYSLVAGGHDHALVLLRDPAANFGGTLLIAEGRYWLLLPRSTRAIELSESSIVRGDVGMGDIARTNLAARYEPVLLGQESVEGEPCWKLELTATDPRCSYPRILYWVSAARFEPLQLEYHGRTGSPLKRARCGPYLESAIGLAPARIEVQDLPPGGRTSTMVFSSYRKANAGALDFTPDGMVRFRDAAVSRWRADRPPPRLEEFAPSLFTRGR